MALWALTKSKSPEAERIAKRLLRRGGMHSGAHSALQGLWIAAMSAHFLNSPAPAEVDDEVVVKLNGKDWATLDAEHPHSVKFNPQADPKIDTDWAFRSRIDYDAANGFLLVTHASAKLDPVSDDKRHSLLQDRQPQLLPRKPPLPRSIPLREKHLAAGQR